MTLKEQINADFMTAYKAKELEKKNFLGVLKGAIQTKEGQMIPSTDENVLKTIKNLEKGLIETIEAKLKLGQDTSNEKMELEYLKPYLPTLMSEEEIKLAVRDILSRPDINKNQGFLMGTFNKEQKGKAFDNKLVLQILNSELVY